MGKNKVTLMDIAKAVGCSKGLVSLALSDSSLVNEESRSEIILTALKMGYKIENRKIRASKQTTVSLIVNDFSYVNEFYWEVIVKNIINLLSEKEILLDLVLYNDTIDHDGMLLELVNKKTNGLIVVAKCDDQKALDLSVSGLPIVLLDVDYCCDPEYDSVRASNYACGYYAAKYLAGKGHKRMGFVGSENMALSFRQRRNGFKDGVKQMGEEYTYTDVSMNGTHSCRMFNKKRVLSALRGKNPPTAFFCANDVTACDLYDVLTAEGLKVPENVSLIGFDNIEKNHPLIGSLTTFNVDKKEFAKVCVDLLSQRMANPRELRRQIEISCPLIERGSVKNMNE